MLDRIDDAGLPLATELVIGSFEQALLQLAFYGDQKTIDRLRAAKDAWLNVTEPFQQAVFKRGCDEVWTDLAILSDFQHFYATGNIPLGLDADNNLLLLYQD
jgi:hypothetical protein